MRLVDGTDRAPIDNATIVVRDGRIAAAGPAASVTIPAGAERVSLAGKTVIPGLINAHGHVNNVESRSRHLRRVRRDDGLQPRRRRQRAGGYRGARRQATPSLDRARIFTSGPVLDAEHARGGRADVAKVAAMKVDIVKIRVDDNLGTTPKMAPEVYRAVIDEAHKRGLRVAVHLFYLADARACSTPAPTSSPTASATPTSTPTSSPRSRRATSASARR